MIRIGSKWYQPERRDSDGKQVLVAVDAPETEPAEFFNGDEVLAKAVDVDITGLKGLAEEALSEFVAARKAYRENVTGEGLAAAMETAKTKALVLNHEYGAKVAELNAANLDIDLPDAPEDVAQPWPLAEPGKEEPVKEEQAPAKTSKSKPAAKPTDASEVQVLDPAVGETIETVPAGVEMELVAATAAKAAVEAVQASRQAPAFTNNRPVNVRDLVPSGGPMTPGKDGERKRAKVTAMAGTQVVDTGAEIGDQELLEMFQDFERHNGSYNQQSRQASLASYHVYDRSDAEFVDPNLPSTFAAVRANGSLTGSHRRTVHADGSTCDNCVITPDVRREIPDIGLDVDPLGGLLQTYPSPHCNLEYYQALSLADIDAGVTIWDNARKTAFCTARDAWYASLRAGTPDMAQYQAMKAAEKDCAIPSCVPKDNTVPEAVSVCLKYPLEMEHCNPELIVRYREALMRMFTIRKNQRRLEMMDPFHIPVAVDAAAAPFINPAGIPMDGMHVVMEVLMNLMKRGQMAEYATAGNYALITNWGMVDYLESSRYKSVKAEIESFSQAIGMPVIEVPTEVPTDQTTANVQAAIGQPWGFGALPQTTKQGAAAPVAYGSAGLPHWPRDWTVRMVDLDDFFEVSRPTVTLGAQVTPDDAVQNMVFGMFQEEFFGIGKDGIHPSWKIDFASLCNNGARIDGIAPVAC